MAAIPVKIRPLTTREEAPVRPYSTLYDASFNKTWSNIFQKDFAQTERSEKPALTEQQDKFGKPPTGAGQTDNRCTDRPPPVVKPTMFRRPGDNIKGFVWPDPEPDPWSPNRVVTYLKPDPKCKNRLLYHESSLLPENRPAAILGKKKDLAVKPHEQQQPRRECLQHMCANIIRRSNATTQFDDKNPAKMFHEELDLMIRHRMYGKYPHYDVRKSISGSKTARPTVQYDASAPKGSSGAPGSSISRPGSQATGKRSSAKSARASSGSNKRSTKQSSVTRGSGDSRVSGGQTVPRDSVTGTITSSLSSGAGGTKVIQGGAGSGTAKSSMSTSATTGTATSKSTSKSSSMSKPSTASSMDQSQTTESTVGSMSKSTKSTALSGTTKSSSKGDTLMSSKSTGKSSSRKSSRSSSRSKKSSNKNSMGGMGQTIDEESEATATTEATGTTKSTSVGNPTAGSTTEASSFGGSAKGLSTQGDAGGQSTTTSGTSTGGTSDQISANLKSEQTTGDTTYSGSNIKTDNGFGSTTTESDSTTSGSSSDSSTSQGEGEDKDSTDNATFDFQKMSQSEKASSSTSSKGSSRRVSGVSGYATASGQSQTKSSATSYKSTQIPQSSIGGAIRSSMGPSTASGSESSSGSGTGTGTETSAEEESEGATGTTSASESGTDTAGVEIRKSTTASGARESTAGSSGAGSGLASSVGKLTPSEMSKYEAPAETPWKTSLDDDEIEGGASKGVVGSSAATGTTTSSSELSSVTNSDSDGTATAGGVSGPAVNSMMNQSSSSSGTSSDSSSSGSSSGTGTSTSGSTSTSTKSTSTGTSSSSSKYTVGVALFGDSVIPAFDFTDFPIKENLFISSLKTEHTPTEQQSMEGKGDGDTNDYLAAYNKKYASCQDSMLSRARRHDDRISKRKLRKSFKFCWGSQ